MNVQIIKEQAEIILKLEVVGDDVNGNFNSAIQEEFSKIIEDMKLSLADSTHSS